MAQGSVQTLVTTLRPPGLSSTCAFTAFMVTKSILVDVGILLYHHRVMLSPESGKQTSTKIFRFEAHLNRHFSGGGNDEQKLQSAL